MRLYRQTELLDSVRAMMRDTSANQRYGDADIYRALNMALSQWGRYRSPAVYEVDGGVSSARQLALPTYMDDRIVVQFRPTSETATTEAAWHDLQGYRIVGDGDGGLQLEFSASPMTGDIRILWWIEPPTMPTTVATSSADYLSTDESLVLNRPEYWTPPLAGYLYSGGEWMLYKGRSLAANTVTVSNLDRGQNGTTASAIATDAEVEVGVPVMQEEQFALLVAYTLRELHLLSIADANNTEKGHHATLVQYWSDEATRLKRMIKPRQPAVRLSHLALQNFDSGWWRN